MVTTSCTRRVDKRIFCGVVFVRETLLEVLVRLYKGFAVLRNNEFGPEQRRQKEESSAGTCAYYNRQEEEEVVVVTRQSLHGSAYRGLLENCQ
jgi:hypothetical protein